MKHKLLIGIPLISISAIWSLDLVPGDTVESNSDTISSEQTITTKNERFSKLKDKFFGKNWDKSSTSPDMDGVFSSDAVGEIEFEVLEDKVVVTLDIPGAGKEDIDVQVTNNNIMVSADVKIENIQKDSLGNIISKSSSTNSFSQSQSLPEEVDPEVRNTTYENGVLKIELKRK